MGRDLLFLDVETPNGRNDRISSIGLIRCSAECVPIAKESFLVNPEEPFSDLNMRITGLCPVDVEDAPTFPELWDSSLKHLFADAVLVAHNATFDLSVLWKLFGAYSLGAPDWSYACTKNLSQQWHPEFPDYKLPTVCGRLGVVLENHHQALDDADACRMVYQALLEEDSSRVPTFVPYRPGGEYQRHYSFNRSEGFSQKKLSEKTVDYRGFLNLCESIVSNGTVSTGEALAALIHIELHERLKDDPSVEELSSLLMCSLADGDIDDGESNRLIELLRRLINPCESSSSPKTIQIDGKSFCLTGSFNHGSKEKISQFLLDNGGTVLKGVSKKCDYVLVGGQGSEMWTTKNYGSKVKKALDLQAKGDDIVIVGEDSIAF